VGRGNSEAAPTTLRIVFDALREELSEWLRIPSISTGDGDPADLRRAAEWVVERVREAGGEAQVVETGMNPLAVGDLRAAAAEAPTVLIYGHYDVQSVGDPAAWESPPFEPTVRDGRLYARGASDDKGNFLPLLHVACELARAGALPVHVRVLVEGEEEAGGESASEWLRADERGADVAIVFDSDMADEHTPAITVGLRGMVLADVTVRTAARDLHSGIYGGSVLNALHVLHAMLAQVMPGPDGRLRDELRAGIEPASPAERDSWARLRPGDEVLAEVGGRPVHPGAGGEYYERNGADASLDVNFVEGGEPRTVVPSVARAQLSMRLAPRQRSADMQPVVERLLRDAAPEGAEVSIDWHLAEPSLFDVDEPAIRLAAQAIERATGSAPVMQRSGGSIPIVAELAAAGIPTIVGGFALADDAIHAPNESYRLESLRLGEAAARELYTALAELPSGRSSAAARPS
jgi:acetylornithine deacetylase/succinyl-diaminopimelate desuccinylase-like protein